MFDQLLSWHVRSSQHRGLTVGLQPANPRDWRSRSQAIRSVTLLRNLIHLATTVVALGSVALVSLQGIELSAGQGNWTPGAQHDGLRLPPGMIGQLKRLDDARRSLAVDEMTVLATIVEAHSMHEEHYPGRRNEFGPIDQMLKPVADLYSMDVLPLEDPWGQPYLYWTDGHEYIIVSYGSDRRSASAYGDEIRSTENGHRGTLCPRSSDDLMWVNGMICQRASSADPDR